MDKIFLLILTLVGALLRFANINWDKGFFLHPDERNIGASVWGIDWPNNLNPHFFVYGSFPIYFIFLLGNIANFLLKNRDWTFWDGAILIGRFLSAFLSTLLIPLSYKITHLLVERNHPERATASRRAPLLTAFFVTTSVGLIQYAHFATFEIFLTFEYLLLFYLSLKILHLGQTEWAKDTKFSRELSETATKTISRNNDTSPANVFQKIFRIRAHLLLFATGIIVGLSLSTKITSLSLLPLPLLALLWNTKLKRKFLLEKTSQIFIFIIISALTFLLTSPYAILDFKSFKYSLDYEIAVGRGLPVFFTSQFLNTTPILFQFTKIFPFILNPLLTLLLIPALIWFIYQSITRFSTQKSFALCPPAIALATAGTLIFALLFAPAFLFIKWTRYMIPLLPFLYITLSLYITETANNLYKLLSKVKSKSFNFYIFNFLFVFLIFYFLFFIFFYSLAFFNIYLVPHTTIQTASWMSKNLPKSAKILTEDLDQGIDVIKPKFQNLTTFNFYDLDSPNFKEKLDELNQRLKTNDYFLILSRRVYKNRFDHPDKFPNGAKFYQNLFAEKLSFKKIHESQNPFSLFNIEINDDSAEETFQVFDHPKLFLFKKL